MVDTAASSPAETSSDRALRVDQRRSTLQGCGRKLAAVREDCLALRTELHQALLSQQLFVANPVVRQLSDVQGALDELVQTTERFATVIDLTVAAVELLDATTYGTAHRCVEEHVLGCQRQLAAVRYSLADYAVAQSGVLKPS
jgi:hypothetical protein